MHEGNRTYEVLFSLRISPHAHRLIDRGGEIICELRQDRNEQVQVGFDILRRESSEQVQRGLEHVFHRCYGRLAKDEGRRSEMGGEQGWLQLWIFGLVLVSTESQTVRMACSENKNYISIQFNPSNIEHAA